MKIFFKKSFLLSFVVLSLVIGFYTFSAKSYAAGNNAEAGDAGALFKKRCATCHGNDGQAKNFRGRVMHATNLTSGSWQNNVSDEHIYNVISGGKKDMPSFKDRLSADEINSLVTYIRGLKK